MTTSDWNNSVHPDLVDDEPATPAQTPPARVQSRGRGRASETAGAGTPAADEAASGSSEEAPDAARSEPEQAEPAPDLAWFDAVREAKDPTEALRSILKNVPYDQLEKDEVFSGLIGNVAERRLKTLQARQEREAQEKAKLDAAASGDLYTLGEMTQRELQQQLASQQAAQAAGPFMDGVVAFQKTLPESIQREIAGKAYGAGKSYAEGVAEYMADVSERQVKLELQKRESALRKSLMAELNGDEPVPERDSGTPSRVREVTDEQIAAMSLAEYDALFDENNRPKPGVRHRPTRSIPLTQH